MVKNIFNTLFFRSLWEIRKSLNAITIELLEFDAHNVMSQKCAKFLDENRFLTEIKWK